MNVLSHEWRTVAIWGIWLAIFGILEGFGLTNKYVDTFTSFVRSWLPIQLRFVLIMWLLWHFVIDLRNYAH